MKDAFIVSFTNDSSSQRTSELLIVSDIIKKACPDYYVSSLFYVKKPFLVNQHSSQPYRKDHKIYYGAGDVILIVHGLQDGFKHSCLEQCHTEYKQNLIDEILVSEPVLLSKIENNCELITDNVPASGNNDSGREDAFS